MRGLWYVAVATLRLLVAVEAAVAPDLQHQVDRDVQPPAIPLEYRGTESSKSIKPGTELRILEVGDSITYGVGSYYSRGGGGNGYRLMLQKYLSEDKLVHAGTEREGHMDDGYFAAWNGATIQYIADHVGPSLAQRPNIILLHAGTNDMNPDNRTSTEGHDPVAASERLGSLIDMMTTACPDAVVLVAMIINTCVPKQAPQTKVFQSLVPKVVAPRLQAGKHVLAVDFSTFHGTMSDDCIHPWQQGYRVMADYWFDFLAQIPKDWITAPVGPDPKRGSAGRLTPSTPLLGLLGLLFVLMYA
ncbi:carbohydrate esterase family 3 protein [Trichoderma chlorosporum]